MRERKNISLIDTVDAVEPARGAMVIPAQLELFGQDLETEDPRSALERRLDLSGAYVVRFARLFARWGALRVVVVARDGRRKIVRFTDARRAAVFCAAVRLAGLAWQPARA